MTGLWYWTKEHAGMLAISIFIVWILTQLFLKIVGGKITTNEKRMLRAMGITSLIDLLTSFSLFFYGFLHLGEWMSSISLCAAFIMLAAIWIRIVGHYKIYCQWILEDRRKNGQCLRCGSKIGIRDSGLDGEPYTEATLCNTCAHAPQED